MKFGIAIPGPYNESVEINRINGNTYRQDATKKEMKDMKVSFKFLEASYLSDLRISHTI